MSRPYRMRLSIPAATVQTSQHEAQDSQPTIQWQQLYHQCQTGGYIRVLQMLYCTLAATAARQPPMDPESTPRPSAILIEVCEWVVLCFG